MFEDEHIKSAELFGIRGQGQYGIDIEADRHDGGLDVGQCKCYEKFPPRKIAKAAKEFIKHWDEIWKARDVRRFILLVACDLRTTQQRKEIANWQVKFKKIGVEFEAWSNSGIRDRLRPHPGIVSNFFDPAEYWVKKICGHSLPEYSLPQAPNQGVSAIIEAQLEHFTDVANTTAKKELDEINNLISAGKPNSALDQIAKVKSDKSLWKLIDDETKAKALRVEASLRLDGEDGLQFAKKLADEAEAFHQPEGVPQLRALIAWTEDGAEAAFELVKDASSAKDKLFKAGLLAALDRYDEIETEIKDIKVSGTDEANLWRLRSLVRLNEKKLDDAVKCISKAYEITPGSYIIRYVLGTLEFYSAISPVLTPRHVLSYPDPVDWVFVSSKDESKERLKRSETIFKQIEKDCELSTAQELQNQCWRLACMACDSERMEEAEDYCRALLRSTPTHPHAIAWAINRGFLEDREFAPCQAALRETLSLNPGVGAVLSLCVICLRFDEYSEATSLLEEHKDLFDQRGLEELWKLWRVQVSDPKEPIPQDVKKAIGDISERTELVLIEHGAEDSGDVSDIVVRGEAALNGDIPSIILGDVCRFLSRNSHWEFIAENSRELVERIGTAPVLEMAVIAAHESRRFDDALSLLADYSDLFSGGTYPPRIVRIKLSSQRALGKFPDAMHEARILANQTGSPEDFMFLADLCVQKGDVDGVQSVAAELKAKQSLSAEGALHFSNILSAHKPEFAKELLDDAVKEGIDAGLVAEAYILAQRMGVATEYDDLTNQFNAQLQQGQLKDVIEFASEEDLRNEIIAQQENLATRENYYNKGKGPIHFLLQGSNSTLAYCYHQLRHSVSMVDDAFEAPPLLIRHGGRPYYENFPESPFEIRLHLDITALLMGHHLGILGDVERCFGKIRLPHETPVALLQMQQDALSYHQGRYEDDLAFLKLVENGGATTKELAGENPEAIAKSCIENGGKALLWGKDKIENEKLDSCRVNCRTIADSLLSIGAISSPAHKAALRALGAEGKEGVDGTILEKDDIVYCTDGIATNLSRAKLLGAASKTFQLMVSSGSVDLSKQICQEVEQRKALGEWIAELRDRISRGIDSGTIEIMPIVKHGAEHQQEFLKDKYDYAVLGALMASKYENGSVTWVDDRFVNSHQSINQAATFSVVDILQALRFYEAFDEVRYADLLFILRNENHRFIPLIGDELLFHITNAVIKDGQVQETPELLCLRRYYAASFLDTSELQDTNQPEGSPNPHGELNYLVQYNRAIERAVTGLWGIDEVPIEEKILKSNWLFDSLFVERFPFMPKWVGSKENHTHFVSIYYSGFIAQAMGLCTIDPNNEDKKCSDYLEWLYEHILEPRFSASPELLQAVCDFVGELAFKDKALPLEEDPEFEKHKDILPPTMLVIQWKLLKRIPGPLRQRLEKLDHIQEKFGSSWQNVITLGNHPFKFEKLSDAVKKAAKNKKAEINTANDKIHFEVTKHKPESDGGFSMLFSQNGEGEFTVSTPANCVLLPDRKERRNCLQHYLFELDISEGLSPSVVDNLVDIPDEYERLEAVLDMLDDSCTVQYDIIGQQLERDKFVRLSEIAPRSGESLLRYLRLRDHPEEPFNLSESAQFLIDELGLDEAIWRMAGLPCPMPDSIIESLDSLTEEERKTVITDFGQRVSSYFSGFHFINLAQRYLINDDERLAAIIEDWLTSPHFVEIVDIHLTVYRWILAEVGNMSSLKDYPLQVRATAAWSHSSQLMAVFSADRIPGEGFISSVRGKTNKLGIQGHLFATHNGIDVCDTASLRKKGFIASALGFALEYSGGNLLTEKSSEWINDNFADLADEIVFPTSSVLRETSLGRNGINSFLGLDYGTVFKRLGQEEISEKCSSEFLKNLVVDLLAEFEGPELDDKWAVLATVMPYGTVYDDVYSDFKKWAMSIDFVLESQKHWISAMACLAYFTGTAVTARDQELVAFVWDQLCNVVKDGKRDGYNRDISGKHEAGSVIEIAWKIALGEEGLDAFALKLSELISELVEHDEQLVFIARRVVTKVCEELPIGTVERLSNLLFHLRAKE